jgi:hypothetical protein
MSSETKQLVHIFWILPAGCKTGGTNYRAPKENKESLRNAYGEEISPRVKDQSADD